MATNRIGRIGLAGLVAVGIIGGGIADADQASAQTGHEYTTTDDVWLHGDPGLGDEGDLITVMPAGTRFEADCYVNDSPVGELGNSVWLHGTDQNGNTGFFTDYYSSSSWNLENTLHDQGLPFCGETPPQPSQPSESSTETVPVFASFDRQVAADWALAHSQDTPPNAGLCTWIVTRALIAGGLQETPDCNDDWHSINRDGLEYGTDNAWMTQDFLNYFRHERPDAEVRNLETMNAGNNGIPGAGLGDIIVYNWDGGEVDHAAVIVGLDGQYPLVAGWSENGSQASDYQHRGWTWSEKSDQFLQSLPGHQDMTATLIHIRTEDDVLAELE